MLKGVILDLDGTVYMGEDEVPGAGRFVAWARNRGARCLFVTNRANRKADRVAAQLTQCGIPCGVEDILTSAQATAHYLGQGSVYCIGEAGLRDELTAAGLRFDDQAPDAVVVSFDRTFDYGKLLTACRLITAGARFIATNPDAGLKTPEGILPGTGAIVAAVAAGSGVAPTVVGKPERLIFDMALERMGLNADDVIAVGDNVATDVPAGTAAGIRTALILTGISTREEAAAAAVQPTWVVKDYAALTARIEELDAPGNTEPRT